MKQSSCIALLILTICFVPATMNAQAAILALIFGDKIASEDFNLSMEFGVNSSGITNFQEHHRGINSNFGVAGNIKLSDKFYLCPSTFFSSGRKIKLEKYSLNSSDISLNQEFIETKGAAILKYIDVNLPLFYQMNKFRIGIAPQVSFLQGANIKLDHDLGTFDYKIEHEVNNLDYGLLSILSYELGLAREGKGLFIQLRYSQGFNDAFKAPVSRNNRNNYFSIHLSLPFITDELAQKKLQSSAID